MVEGREPVEAVVLDGMKLQNLDRSVHLYYECRDYVYAGSLSICPSDYGST